MFGASSFRGIVIQPRATNKMAKIVVTNWVSEPRSSNIDYVGNMESLSSMMMASKNRHRSFDASWPTNPDNLGTSGNDVFSIADFTAAGAVGTPLVSVSDAAGRNSLPKLRNTQGRGRYETFGSIFAWKHSAETTRFNLTGRAMAASISGTCHRAPGSDTLTSPPRDRLTYVAATDGDLVVRLSMTTEPFSL